MADTPLPPVLHRLWQAWNAHDGEAVAACLQADYQSQQPLHPERNFAGREVARQSWDAIFNAIPNFRAELQQYAVNGSQVWTEWRWRGDHTDGPAFSAGGVMIFEIADDHIAAVRAYTETQTLACPDFDQILDDILHEA
jgi:ketosteroid isomerase-like protein